jgi:hypothetical protein
MSGGTPARDPVADKCAMDLVRNVARKLALVLETTTGIEDEEQVQV